MTSIMAAKRKQIDLETKLEIINNANKLTPSELAITSYTIFLPIALRFCNQWIRALSKHLK